MFSPNSRSCMAHLVQARTLYGIATISMPQGYCGSPIGPLRRSDVRAGACLGLSRQGLMRMVSAEERAPAFAPPRRPRAAPIPDHVTLDVGRGHVFAEDQRQRVGGVLQVGFRAVKLLKVLVVLSNVS